jgi:hypothetical protein
MPQEERSADLRYLIKSDAEAHERNVLECELSSDVGVESERICDDQASPPAGLARNVDLFLPLPSRFLELVVGMDKVLAR